MEGEVCSRKYHGYHVADGIGRAVIEEDYSKRLSKLAKQALGRDEIGYGRRYFFIDDHH